ncbi:hypothetical protein ACGF7U_19875 [Micromonospora sp. NPDC047670]|uniref:hypothetical protein n=1 Tax=Micromonospora sp. NPDC047670 TaxID=3364252 RepID=UPI0037197492
MGLDLYVGPLTRYHLDDWLTITQQIGAREGYDVRVLRAHEEEDGETDPDMVQSAVREWQQWLGEALGGPVDWPEDPSQPYWTDKPDWDGFGAVLLLAAYDERPDLCPSPRDKQDSAREFADAPAYQAASAQPERYLSLLSGVEWWLPLAEDPLVFEASRPTGQPTRMASTDRLVAELRLLDERAGVLAGYDPAELRRGLFTDDPTVAEVARFGLAVMLDLAETATKHRQPLLLDY